MVMVGVTRWCYFVLTSICFSYHDHCFASAEEYGINLGECLRAEKDFALCIATALESVVQVSSVSPWC